MANSEKEISIIEDANIVAYLVTKGFRAVPFVKDGLKNNSRVAWTIEDDITEAVEDYYQGCNVDVYSFVKSLKDVRAEMYNLKQTNKNQTQKGE